MVKIGKQSKYPAYVNIIKPLKVMFSRNISFQDKMILCGIEEKVAYRIK